MNKNLLVRSLSGLAVAAVAMATALIVPGAASAQSWPERPVTFVVPSAAGGSPDVLSRIVMNEVSRVIGQPVVIENRPGAAGNIGLLQVINRPADGYTFGYGNVNTLAVNRALFTKLPYDVDRDLAPVSHTFSLYNVLIVSASAPYPNVAALIEAARRQPGKLSFGAPGVGTTGHMSGEVFRAMAGIDVLHIPYTGGPAALQDLIGGRTDFLFANSSEVVPLVKAGKVRALGVTSLRRLDQLPDVPTLDEAGLKGYETTSWGGVVAAKGTPVAIVDRFNAAIDEALKAPELRAKLAGLGAIPIGGPVDVFRQTIDRETRRWAEIIDTAKIEKLSP